ncbi:helix-turn-helix domain-containing protein [Bacillus amyloliquefaciens]|uniref:Transcriptional regulator n=1 Tax=Bacillus amyloliquefaciens TaxID=1390 RepID=A0AAP7TAC5_BACAM|nr:helix-turn-helix transcriptional regulator [Bacillus amyloliquefaciens]OIK20274.1 transcriptional regulator [Bacillus amyloliquefaciens]
MRNKNKRHWLQKIRQEAELTQKEVAEKANIARTTYAMIESGARNPTPQVAKGIAGVLNFSWIYFFEDGCRESCNKKTCSA